MRASVRCLLALTLILTASVCFGSELLVRQDFAAPVMELKASAGFSSVSMEGAIIQGRPGSPQLPWFGRMIEIPAGARFAGRRVVFDAPREIGRNIRVEPIQKPGILSQRPSAMEFATPDPSIYLSNEPFPHEAVRFTGIHIERGVRYASFIICPVSYRPLSGSLTFRSFVEISLDLVPAPVGADAKNPPTEDRQYLIITNGSFSDEFQRLADWKSKKGIPAVIKTVEWIASEYEGADLAEKVRACIREAYLNWNTQYVLLGGDMEIVPLRYAWAMDCAAGYHEGENDIPCDMYFAALDGDWNADGDNVYGETTDDVDLLPDVHIGRASVDSLAEAAVFVDKTLGYERNPPMDYQKRVLFLAETLWDDPYTPGGYASDLLDERCFDDRYDPISKKYEDTDSLDLEIAISELNGGPHFVNHIGHCFWSLMGVNGYLSNEDVNALHNGNRQFVINSLGCWPAAIDYDAIGEHFVSNADGGAIAFVGNTRYGWGSPGNSGYGYSDVFQEEFWRQLLARRHYRLGEALAEAKKVFVPFSGDENVYRWIQYQLVLLGDPELAVYPDTPKIFEADIPKQLVAGETSFTVTVRNAGFAVPDARVCIRNGHDLYLYGDTNMSGQVTFQPEISVGNPLELTITRPEFLPFEETVQIEDSGLLLMITETQINDSTGESEGNGDGYAGPGETVELRVELKNAGSQSAEAVSASLVTNDPGIEIAFGGPAVWPGLKPGDSAVSVDPFVLRIDPGCLSGCTAYLNLEITLGEEQLVVAPVALLIRGPKLVAGDYWTEPTAKPGSEIELDFYLRNDGLATAEKATVHIVSDDPYVNITAAEASFPNIPANEQHSAETPFRIEISSDCPAGHFPVLSLGITADRYETEEQITLVVGASGFFDDMESGPDKWTFDEGSDLWHITDYRTFAGSGAWYFGDVNKHEYANDMNAGLVSEPFFLAPESQLTLQRWFQLTTYGSDGLYVEIKETDGEWRRLDYIGSGGALGTMPIISSWCLQTYDLSGFSGEAQLRFRFKSDGEDIEEGVYIDDIKVIGRRSISTEETPTPQATNTPRNTSTPGQVDTPSPSATPILTETPTAAQTAATRTETPVCTPSPAPSATPADTATDTPVDTPRPTNTSPPETNTPTPLRPTNTPTVCITSTSSPTPTDPLPTPSPAPETALAISCTQNEYCEGEVMRVYISAVNTGPAFEAEAYFAVEANDVYFFYPDFKSVARPVCFVMPENARIMDVGIFTAVVGNWTGLTVTWLAALLDGEKNLINLSEFHVTFSESGEPVQGFR